MIELTLPPKMAMTNPLDHKFLSANDVIMVPRESTLQSRSDAKIDIPYIYSAPMDTVTGYALAKAMLEIGESPVVSRFISREERLHCIKDFHANEHCWFAIGLNEDPTDLLETAGVEEGTLNVAIDIAVGDSVHVHRRTQALSQMKSVAGIMSGSICTPYAAIRAVMHGCTHLRVGVGPGAACTTRLKTGCGMPQLSAIYLIHRALQSLPIIFNPGTPGVYTRNQVTIIADGGIKQPGDANKYLGAGANAIMMGSVLSKTRESVGWEAEVMPLDEWTQYLAEENNGAVPFPLPSPPMTFLKSYRGQASADFQVDQYGKPNVCPEGAASDYFEWDGHTDVNAIVNEYRGGLRSALSYLGLEWSSDLHPDNVQFIEITAATYMEGTPHGI